jgi:hypothetical protein
VRNPLVSFLKGIGNSLKSQDKTEMFTVERNQGRAGGRSLAKSEGHKILIPLYSFSDKICLPCCCIKFGAQIHQTFGYQEKTLKSMSSAGLIKW